MGNYTAKIIILSLMVDLKCKSTLIIFDRHVNLKYKFANGHCVAKSFYVSTLVLNEAMIKNRYKIKKKYILTDKLSVKEFFYPFKVHIVSINLFR